MFSSNRDDCSNNFSDRKKHIEAEHKLMVRLNLNAIYLLLIYLKCMVKRWDFEKKFSSSFPPYTDKIA